MSNPIQTERIVEAMAEAAANASGGYDMWKGLGEVKRNGWREIAQAALSTALPMIMAEVERAVFSVIACETNASQRRILAAIRTTELPLAEKERE